MILARESTITFGTVELDVVLEHVKSAIPQHSLDIIDGAQHRSSNYDDLSHPTRD